ncbi:MAG: aminoglycoside phosphotransferase family protein [Armatimonadota bacterium]|nr:aminoglycoside phosphotransferase family protein [Armatimonadota bacterium]
MNHSRSEWPRHILETLVRRHVSVGDGPLAFTPIATGKFNRSYYVTGGNRDLLLRIAPPAEEVFLFYERHMMRQEPELHALLRARTAVPVPEILAFDESHAVIPRAYLLMERLPGRPLTEMPGVDEDAVLRQVGACLAQVHRLTAERYGYLGAHRPMPPQESWPQAFRVMWNKLLDDVVGVSHYTLSERQALSELLERHLPLFDRPTPAALLHMDVWHQNILVDATGRLTGLVDWDRALWGDPEIEFAVLDYCGISQPAFWEGYGASRDTSPEAETRRVFYLLYELQKYIVIRQGRDHDPFRARRYKHQVMEIVCRHRWPCA